jgi:hypothetical protein
VRKAGKRLRLTAQLIDVSTDAHIWADKFDGDLEDIFDLQDHLTSSVIGAISPLPRARIIHGCNAAATGGGGRARWLIVQMRHEWKA